MILVCTGLVKPVENGCSASSRALLNAWELTLLVRGALCALRILQMLGAHRTLTL